MHVEVMSSISDGLNIMKQASPRYSKIPSPLIHEERVVSDERMKRLVFFSYKS